MEQKYTRVLVIVGFIASFVIGISSREVFFNASSHPMVDEWSDKSCSLNIQIFNDHSAIYAYRGLGVQSCEWKDQSKDLLVIKCDNHIGDQKLTMTLKSNGMFEAYLDGLYKGVSRNEGYEMFRSHQNGEIVTCASR